ncbi:MAG: hypothetical protein H6835_01880 [Planctomycetes bacterium]|nr:hypothetical protein [Planctomycetota bacterium]
MAPGDDAEPGSGARIALRTVLAAAEAHLQPSLQRHLQQLDELGAAFGERIREQFAGALPAGDLEALHEGLQTLGQGRVALSTLAGDSTRRSRAGARRRRATAPAGRDGRARSRTCSGASPRDTAVAVARAPAWC